MGAIPRWYGLWTGDADTAVANEVIAVSASTEAPTVSVRLIFTVSPLVAVLGRRSRRLADAIDCKQNGAPRQGAMFLTRPQLRVAETSKILHKYRGGLTRGING